MDRLNERLSNLKQGVENMTEPEIKVSKLFLESVCEYLQKLKDYKDLEEQGLLLKLPCKVGDTVYAYCSEFGILEYEVDEIIIDKKITFLCSAYSEPIGDCPSECLDEIEPDITDFSKTVFLTKEEAEHVTEEKLKDNLATQIAKFGLTDKQDARDRIDFALQKMKEGV